MHDPHLIFHMSYMRAVLLLLLLLFTISHVSPPPPPPPPYTVGPLLLGSCLFWFSTINKRILLLHQETPAAILKSTCNGTPMNINLPSLGQHGVGRLWLAVGYNGKSTHLI